MKPRIFIAIHYLHLGGAETSLIGLLQSLDPQKVDVDLFVYSHEGEMMQLIPSYVNLLPEDSAWSMFEKPLKEVLKKGYWRMFLARMWAKFRMRQYVRCTNPTDGSAIMGYLGEEVSKVLPGLHHYGVYDLAISFLTPHNFVLNHVTAKKKVCWIHTDYTHIDVNADLELPVWSAYDHVISISEDVTKTFLQVFPSLKDKIVEIENVLSPDYVRQRSLLISLEDIQKEMPARGDCINLLTIGRFSEAKKLDEIPAICRGIIEAGVNVRWYIIGYGGSDEYIRKEIVAEGMQERVFLLGKKDNPYPYIKACDWYVQPSRYEGFGLTVAEAMAAKVPVLVSSGQGPAEVTCNEKYGWVFKNGDTDDLVQKISYIIEHQDLTMNKALLGLQYVCENYDVSITAKRYIEEYKKFLS
jgi:glycosyltransferase involved in cell wall biosynthesis